MTITQWQEFAAQINARARRIDHSLCLQANAAATRAGIGPYRNVWTNAQISRDEGRPWEGVDYGALRQAEYFDRLRGVAGELARRIIERAYCQLAREARLPSAIPPDPICGPVVSWHRPYRSGRLSLERK